MQQVFIALPVHLQGLSLAQSTGRNKRMVFSFLCTQQQEDTFACHLIQSMQSEPWIGSYWVLCPMKDWELQGPGAHRAEGWHQDGSGAVQQAA